MKKKVILITGTSRGIGEGIEKYLLSKGHIVYGSSREGGKGKFHLKLDITDFKSCQEAVHTIVKKEGKIDVIVNNAGFYRMGASEEVGDEELRSQVEINFFGQINMIKAVTAQFLKQKSGKIINISSLGGLLSLPYTSAYNASKFALEGYTEALRHELLPFGIYVSNVIPSYVNTGTINISIGQTKTPIPIFEKYRKMVMQKTEKESARGIPVEKIAKTVSDIVDSEEPAFHYRAGYMSKFMPLLKAILPESIFRKIIFNYFNLPEKAKR